MTAATWILMYKKPIGCGRHRRGAQVLRLGYKNGDKMAEALDYVPMPDNVVADIQKMWSSDIKGADGKPLFD